MNSSQLNSDALPLHEEGDLDPLLERISDARYALLGEASHGTHDYYAWRAAISRRLIQEKGFSFVAVEGDWPDCYAVRESVTGPPDAPDEPQVVLHEFDRWPTWMWANTDVARFTRWLREFNGTLPETQCVGFYGAFFIFGDAPRQRPSDQRPADQEPADSFRSGGQGARAPGRRRAEKEAWPSGV